MTAMFLSQLVEVAAPADAELPSEFRIFKAGRNTSTKGDVWFDEAAARSVMAHAEQWGNDYAIDLEHHSLLFPDSREDASDARGYFRPELRPGPELWAVRVSWTEDGAARLRSRRQRYMSPAFNTRFDQALDGGRGGSRVIELVNVGLVAQPASDALEALVASRTLLDTRSASRYGSVDMNPTDAIKAALEALKGGDVAGATAALEAVAAEAPAEPAPETMSETPDPEPKAEEEDAPAPPEPEALSRQLCAVAGDADAPAALSRFAALVKAERDAEQAERRSLITDLVGLGVETPATAWSNNAPVSRLAAEPIAELRSRVTILRSARGTQTAAHTPPAVNELDGLSEIEQRDAAKITNPELRAKYIAVRKARKASR